MSYHIISQNIFLLKIISYVFLHLVLTDSVQIKDCTEDVYSCEKNYKRKILMQKNTQTGDSVCRIFHFFKHCMDHLDCNIDPEAKYQVINKYDIDLRKNNHFCDKDEEISPINEMKSEISMSTQKVHQTCTSSEQSCKNEYMQTIYAYSGRNESMSDIEVQHLTCSTAKRFINCEKEREECSDAMTTVCREFEQKNIKCDLVPCSTSSSSTLDKFWLQSPAIFWIIFFEIINCLSFL